MDEDKEHAMHDLTHHASDHPEHAAMDHSIHEISDHAAHDTHAGNVMPASTGMGHAGHSAHTGHGVDHTGHEKMFRDRFWWCLPLSIPVLLYSGKIQKCGLIRNDAQAITPGRTTVSGAPNDLHVSPLADRNRDIRPPQAAQLLPLSAQWDSPPYTRPCNRRAVRMRDIHFSRETTPHGRS
jgi:hypothetical protein